MSFASFPPFLAVWIFFFFLPSPSIGERGKLSLSLSEGIYELPSPFFLPFPFYPFDLPSPPFFQFQRLRMEFFVPFPFSSPFHAGSSFFFFFRPLSPFFQPTVIKGLPPPPFPPFPPSFTGRNFSEVDASFPSPFSPPQCLRFFFSMRTKRLFFFFSFLPPRGGHNFRCSFSQPIPLFFVSKPKRGIASFFFSLSFFSPPQTNRRSFLSTFFPFFECSFFPFPFPAPGVKFLCAPPPFPSLRRNFFSFSDLYLFSFPFPETRREFSLFFFSLFFFELKGG